ncbi:MAG: DUF58 domain-containing protein [Planctomycetaceae bacterium]|nr:DUF58 domain-containing protein [Planctomycetaceae bacterium]
MPAGQNTLPKRCCKRYNKYRIINNALPHVRQQGLFQRFSPQPFSTMPDVIELLKKVRQIEIIANRSVNEFFAGQYKSVFRGQGMEFSEVREYQPGDDIRSIDWNVTARVGRPFIKRFVEERELTILFLVDVSRSGMFGSQRSKIETAIETAATLMFSALKNNDKVGLITFADKVIRFYPPRKGKSNVLHLLRELLFTEPTGCRTDMQTALDYVHRTQKRRAVVFLLSDFFVHDLLNTAEFPADKNPQTISRMLSDFSLKEYAVFFRPNKKGGYRHAQTPLEKSLSICAKKHDVIAMTLTDPREHSFPHAGLLTLQDAESGEKIEADTSNPKIRALLSEHFQSMTAQIESLLPRCGVDVLPIESGSDFLTGLRKFFRKRERRVQTRS